MLTHLRPGLVQCYDLADFPRTNNEMERMIWAVKMQYRRISGRKNWNHYLLRYGRCVAYQEWWEQQADGEAQLHARLRSVPSSFWRRVRQETRQAIRSNSIAFVFVIGHWSLLLLWKCGGSKRLVRGYCPHSFRHQSFALMSEKSNYLNNDMPCGTRRLAHINSS